MFFDHKSLVLYWKPESCLSADKLSGFIIYVTRTRLCRVNRRTWSSATEQIDGCRINCRRPATVRPLSVWTKSLEQIPLWRLGDARGEQESAIGLKPPTFNCPCSQTTRIRTSKRAAKEMSAKNWSQIRKRTRAQWKIHQQTKRAGQLLYPRCLRDERSSSMHPLLPTTNLTMTWRCRILFWRFVGAGLDNIDCSYSVVNGVRFSFGLSCFIQQTPVARRRK